MSLDPSIIVPNFTSGTIFLIKTGLLVLMGLYVLFTLMLSTKIRSLNRNVFLPPESGEIIIRIFAIIYFLAVLSLFILTIVIV